MSEEITLVLFRTMNGSSEPTAFFPTYPGTRNVDTCLSYARVGQHGSADLGGCIRRSRPATPEEYAPLKKELERIGYCLRVIQRTSRKHTRNRQRSIDSIK